MAVDETVHTRCGGVRLRARRADDGVRGDVDTRAAGLTEVQLAHAIGTHDRDLELEASLRGAQQLDVGGGARCSTLDRGEQGRPGIGIRRRAGEAPVAHLGEERGTLGVGVAGQQPGRGGVVEIRAAVVAEAHAVKELPRVVVVARLIVDDTRALPDAHEPRERREVGREVGGKLEHVGQR